MTGRLLLARLRDERGSVGVLLSFVIFVVVGMLMMTWNTAQLSKEKMRLQNAADAAALEHAIWQARGLNAVQNLNDEAYFSVQTAFVLTTVAAALETAAKAAELIPFVGVTVVAPTLRLGATIVGGSGSLLSHAALVVIKFAGYFYHYGSAAFGYIGAMQLAKENGATAIFPALNASKAKAFGDFRLGIYALGVSLARPLSTFVLPLKRIKIEGDLYHVPSKEMLFAGKWYSVYSALKVGAEWDFQPLVSAGENEKPETETPPQPSSQDIALKRRMESLTNQITQVEAEYDARKKELKELEERMKPSAAGGFERPEDRARRFALRKRLDDLQQRLDKLSREYVKLSERVSRGVKPGPYRGGGGGLPGSTVWVAFRAKNAIETMDLETWSPGTSSSAMYNAPIVAISAARCVSGDVIPHNRMPKAGEPNQRPVGFGTGATAKLVPVLEALAELGERGEKWKKVSTALQYAVGAVVYH